MAHEIFLSAVVAHADAPKARALLGGFTEMRERHAFTRVQHLEPQDLSVRGLPAIKQLQKERAPTSVQWQELHQILVKQPSSLQVRTDVTEEVHDAAQSRGDSPADIAADKPRVVRWTEFPEPTNPRLPFLTQRKTIDIEDRRAEKILADNKFRIKSNLVEESYHWWLNSVEYVLARSFVLPWDADVAPMQQIPKLASAEPIAPFWILYVRASVKSAAPATIPEHVRKAQAHLVQVRAQLMGVFDFKAFDRRCHDTRIQERPA